MALWTRRVHGLDDNRFPPMGSWKTCVLFTLPFQLATEGLTIHAAGSGKSIIWSVVPF